MGINDYSSNGHIAYGIKEFVIETKEDLNLLPLNCQLGSAALCLGDGKVYFYSPKQKKWVSLGEQMEKEDDQKE